MIKNKNLIVFKNNGQIVMNKINYKRIAYNRTTSWWYKIKQINKINIKLTRVK